ncbi:MAG: hypothetical protein PHW63_11910 [Alphaproteobacteria bacterium]|nr:hypothetical protein [Alphaproteobacteria bacterium]
MSAKEVSNPSEIIEREAGKFSQALKDQGLDLLETVILVTFDTEQGAGMVSLSTEVAPESLRKKMLTKALER